MTVITVSRQFGSGGDEIARGLCEVLQFQPFHKRMIAQAAAEAGLSEPQANDDNQVVSTFLDRLFDITPALGSSGWQDDSPGLYTPESGSQGDAVSVALVQRAVERACQVGRMVIVGRAGQMILRTCPNVVHVRIEAPLDERVRRVKGYLKKTRKLFNSDAELQRDAYDWVLERDAASSQYVRRHYQADWADPLLYHIVLNTGLLSIEQATQVIVRLVQDLSTDK
jgi:cytidylate kinase